MEGNVVKAAWILGGSILASVVIFGVGAIACVVWFSKVSGDQAERISERAAQAVLDAPKNARVAFVQDSPIRVALDASAPIKAAVALEATSPIKASVALDATTPIKASVALDASTPIKAIVGVDEAQPLRVALDTSVPFKVGFENKLPMALRVENSLDEAKGTRAPLVLKLNP